MPDTLENELIQEPIPENLEHSVPAEQPGIHKIEAFKIPLILERIKAYGNTGLLMEDTVYFLKEDKLYTSDGDLVVEKKRY